MLREAQHDSKHTTPLLCRQEGAAEQMSTRCACCRPPLVQAAVQALKAAMMARWSLLAAVLLAVSWARAAAASARLSGGDTNTDRPCVIAATTISTGLTHLQPVKTVSA